MKRRRRGSLIDEARFSLPCRSAACQEALHFFRSVNAQICMHNDRLQISTRS